MAVRRKHGEFLIGSYILPPRSDTSHFHSCSVAQNKSPGHGYLQASGQYKPMWQEKYQHINEQDP